MSDAPKDIVARLNAAKGLVSQWRSGTKTPGLSWREQLRDAYGIPVGAWDVVASPAPGTVRGVPTSPSPPPPPNTPSDTLAEINEHLARLRADIIAGTALTGAEKVRLNDSFTKALTIRARVERDAELLEDRVVHQHPAWRRVRAAVLAALKPYPEAARAVVDALAQAGDA